MKTRQGNFFECVVRYDKMNVDGMMKKVTETYCVEADTFAEAESRISDEMSAYASGEFEIRKINPASYREIFGDAGEKYYKAKLEFVTFDEVTGKEKKTTSSYLVCSDDFSKALSTVQQVMSGTMLDYTTALIGESKVLDVYVRDN